MFIIDINTKQEGWPQEKLLSVVGTDFNYKCEKISMQSNVKTHIKADAQLANNIKKQNGSWHDL